MGPGEAVRVLRNLLRRVAGGSWAGYLREEPHTGMVVVL